MRVIIVSEICINAGRTALSFNGFLSGHKINIIFILGKSISLNKGDVVIMEARVRHICGKSMFIEPIKTKILFEGTS